MLVASAALVDPAGLEMVAIEATADRANRLTVRLRPAYLAESSAGPVTLTAERVLAAGERKEVLRHIKSDDIVHRILFPHMPSISSFMSFFRRNDDGGQFTHGAL